MRLVPCSVWPTKSPCATNGDSDSIACLAGAFHGAAYGMDIWPAEWSKRIEYNDQLAQLGAAWD